MVLTTLKTRINQTGKGTFEKWKFKERTQRNATNQKYFYRNEEGT